MHRSTTTTATLLVTVALSALSGCVTVQQPPAQGPAAPALPSPPPVPRPEGGTRTQVVQAPAREALEMVAPSREQRATALGELRGDGRPEGAGRQERQSAGAGAAGSRPHPQPRRHHAHPRPDRPEQRRRAEAPHVTIPDVAAEVHRNTDVCALGRQYGGWRGDSPEAVVCQQAYGR